MIKYCLIFLCLLLTSCEYPLDQPYPQSEIESKTLFAAFNERPKHLDPAMSYTENEWAIINQILEPPLQYHYLKRPPLLVPNALQEMPSVRKQNAITTYALKFRKDLRFAPHVALPENRKASASDFAYQLKRLADSTLTSPIYSILETHLEGFGACRKQIEMAHAKTTGAFLNLNTVNCQGIRVVSEDTLEIDVHGEYPQFLYWLTTPFFAPTPFEVDEYYFSNPHLHQTFDNSPVGTGPYYLTEYNPNRRIVMERNPYFHEALYPSVGEPTDQENGYLKHAGEKMPFIDRIIFSQERETIPYWIKFLQGYYDRSGISNDMFQQAIELDQNGNPYLTEKMKQKGIQLSTSIQPTTFYFGFNMQDSVVGGFDARAQLLRQAVSIAIDIEELITIFLNGRGVPAQFLIPPGVSGYSEENYNPYVYEKNEYGRLQRRSIEYAKQLLAQAGYPNGIDPSTGHALKIRYDAMLTNSPENQSHFDWMRKQFEKLGIDLEIDATQYSRFQDKLSTGKVQFFMLGWHADYPDPENFLFLLYGKNSRVMHDGENVSNYQNPEFDKWFEKIAVMVPSPSRSKMLNQMMEIAQKDCPLVWGYHPRLFTLTHAWVDPTKPHEIATNTLKYMDLDPIVRRQKQLQWNQPLFYPARGAHD